MGKNKSCCLSRIMFCFLCLIFAVCLILVVTKIILLWRYKALSILSLALSQSLDFYEILLSLKSSKWQLCFVFSQSCGELLGIWETKKVANVTVFNQLTRNHMQIWKKSLCFNLFHSLLHATSGTVVYSMTFPYLREQKYACAVVTIVNAFI